MVTGWDGLMRSRKFWVMVLDAGVSLALYFAAKYMGASEYDDIKVVIALLQPIAVTVVGMIAHEDVNAMKAGLRG